MKDFIVFAVGVAGISIIWKAAGELSEILFYALRRKFKIKYDQFGKLVTRSDPRYEEI